MQVNITINIDDRLVAWVKRLVPSLRTLGIALIAVLGVTGVVASALEGQVAPFLFSSGNVISSAAVNSDLAALFTSSWGVTDAGNYFVVAPQPNTDVFVGIGTSTPAAPLNVTSPAGSQTVAVFNSVNTTGTFIGFTDNTAGTQHSTAGIGSVAGNVVLESNVGVKMGAAGAAIPDIPLMIRGAGVATLSLDAGTGFFQIGSDTASTDDNMAFDWSNIQTRTAAGATHTLHLNPFGGGVEIGSATAPANLTVEDGTITSSGAITASSGNITATVGNIVASAGNITASGGDITSASGDIRTTSGNMSAGGTISATGTVSGSNLPATILFHNTGTGDNGSLNCTGYCTRFPNTPICLAAYLASSGVSIGCSATESSPITCLCAGF